MHLIIGLGNPGPEFDRTRHNVGREILHLLQKKEGFSDFTLDKKYQALVSEGRIGTEKIMLLLPETFMNRSGGAVAKAAQFFKIKPAHIFVLHDDSDIIMGKTKLAFGRSSAGHKGVESIIRALKTKDFWRFRIGIGKKKHVLAEDIVLRKITPKDRELLKIIERKTLQALETSILEGPEIAMNQYNANEK